MLGPLVMSSSLACIRVMNVSFGEFSGIVAVRRGEGKWGTTSLTSVTVMTQSALA